MCNMIFNLDLLAPQRENSGANTFIYLIRYSCCVFYSAREVVVGICGFCVLQVLTLTGTSHLSSQLAITIRSLKYGLCSEVS